jgi:hypothetical protein
MATPHLSPAGLAKLRRFCMDRWMNATLAHNEPRAKFYLLTAILITEREFALLRQ